jgi:hypothetical protein
MINLSILISSSEVSGPGGLLILMQLTISCNSFLLLTVVLNIIYTTLITIIEERKEYI